MKLIHTPSFWTTLGLACVAFTVSAVAMTQPEQVVNPTTMISEEFANAHRALASAPTEERAATF